MQRTVRICTKPWMIVLFNSFYELEPTYIDVLRKTIYGNVHGQAGHLLSKLPIGTMLAKAYFSIDRAEIATNMEVPKMGSLKLVCVEVEVPNFSGRRCGKEKIWIYSIYAKNYA